MAGYEPTRQVHKPFVSLQTFTGAAVAVAEQIRSESAAIPSDSERICGEKRLLRSSEHRSACPRRRPQGKLRFTVKSWNTRNSQSQSHKSGIGPNSCPTTHQSGGFDPHTA